MTVHLRGCSGSFGVISSISSSSGDVVCFGADTAFAPKHRKQCNGAIITIYKPVPTIPRRILANESS